jgi:RNA polymerase sigma factor (sigma-70 family)
MTTQLTPTGVEIILHEADVAARRLARQMRFFQNDLADVKQEFLLDLIARLPAFDPKRGTIGAFAGMVMANRATRLARRANRHRRMYGVSPLSLDEELPDAGGLTRGDLVPESDGYEAILGQRTDRFAESERRLRLETALTILSDEDKQLCACLSQTTIDELTARGRGARTSLYRRVGRIRLELMAAGASGTA